MCKFSHKRKRRHRVGSPLDKVRGDGGVKVGAMHAQAKAIAQWARQHPESEPQPVGNQREEPRP